jgi:hypothetical protein
MDKTDTRSRAARARMILEDEIFMDAIADIERRAIDDLVASQDATEDHLRYCAARVTAARELRRAIEAVMLNGHDDVNREERAKTIV